MENNTQYRPVQEWSFIDADGSKVVVELERWIWTVIYDDGSELIQFDQSGRFHQFKEIDLERVTRFSMVNTDDVKKQINIEVTPDMQPFHFYRNTVLEAGKESEVRLKTYVFGVKERRSMSDTIYNFILPDDRIVQTTNRNFNPIKGK